MNRPRAAPNQDSTLEPRMNVVAYLDRVSAAAGSRVACMVSSSAAEVTVDVVRLIHGDTNPRGPGSKYADVPEIESRTVPGRSQQVYPGSCMVVTELGVPADSSRLSIVARVQPTCDTGCSVWRRAETT